MLIFCRPRKGYLENFAIILSCCCLITRFWISLLWRIQIKADVVGCTSVPSQTWRKWRWSLFIDIAASDRCFVEHSSVAFCAKTSTRPVRRNVLFVCLTLKVSVMTARCALFQQDLLPRPFPGFLHTHSHTKTSLSLLEWDLAFSFGGGGDNKQTHRHILSPLSCS